MKSAAAFTIMLIAMHISAIFTVVVFRVPLSLERLNDIVVLWTIYLPLAPWKMVGVSVLQSTTQMFPPPNVLGWTVVVLSWVVLYACIGYLFSALVAKFK